MTAVRIWTEVVELQSLPQNQKIRSWTAVGRGRRPITEIRSWTAVSEVQVSAW